MEQTIQLVCQHCEATNRLLPERLNDAPVCGRCKQPLFRGEPLRLTATNFDRMLNASDLPFLVDFWAPWCGPCRSMEPIIEEAARQLEPHVRVAKLNTDDENAIAARYAIRSIPTLGIFVGGKLIQHRAGTVGLAPLLEWVRASLQASGRNAA